jgi:small subunit ribosomal protein S2
MKVTFEQIIIAGMLFGHPTCLWHPKIAIYTYGVRKGIVLIDLVKTRKQLKKAQDFLVKIRGEGKEILFVGTKVQAAQAIFERASISNRFFVKQRWLGGMMTNWSTIRISLLQLHRLEREKKDGFWGSLPKKEVSLLQKRLGRLQRYLDGLKGIKSLPGVLIVVGQTIELTAIQESKKLGIPVICRLDTDCDPSLVEIGVPINDDSTARIRLFLGVITQGIQKGRRFYLSKKAHKQATLGSLVEKKRTRIFSD